MKSFFCAMAAVAAAAFMAFMVLVTPPDPAAAVDYMAAADGGPWVDAMNTPAVTATTAAAIDSSMSTTPRSRLRSGGGRGSNTFDRSKISTQPPPHYLRC